MLLPDVWRMITSLVSCSSLSMVKVFVVIAALLYLSGDDWLLMVPADWPFTITSTAKGPSKVMTAMSLPCDATGAANL